MNDYQVFEVWMQVHKEFFFKQTQVQTTAQQRNTESVGLVLDNWNVCYWMQIDKVP